MNNRISKDKINIHFNLKTLEEKIIEDSIENEDNDDERQRNKSSENKNVKLKLKELKNSKRVAIRNPNQFD